MWSSQPVNQWNYWVSWHPQSWRKWTQLWFFTVLTTFWSSHQWISWSSYRKVSGDILFYFSTWEVFLRQAEGKFSFITIRFCQSLHLEWTTCTFLQLFSVVQRESNWMNVSLTDWLLFGFLDVCVCVCVCVCLTKAILFTCPLAFCVIHLQWCSWMLSYLVTHSQLLTMGGRVSHWKRHHREWWKRGREREKKRAKWCWSETAFVRPTGIENRTRRARVESPLPSKPALDPIPPSLLSLSLSLCSVSSCSMLLQLSLSSCVFSALVTRGRSIRWSHWKDQLVKRKDEWTFLSGYSLAVSYLAVFCFLSFSFFLSPSPFVAPLNGLNSSLKVNKVNSCSPKHPRNSRSS